MKKFFLFSFVIVFLFCIIDTPYSFSEENKSPTIEIISPKAGDSFEITTPIEWKSMDPEGQPLSHTIQLQIGESDYWLTLEDNFSGTKLENKLPPQYSIDSGKVRIIVSDGENESSIVSGIFSVNVETGSDITEQWVRWDPFDKKWQPYIVEEPLFDRTGILIFFGIVFCVLVGIGYGIYRLMKKIKTKYFSEHSKGSAWG